MIAPPALLMEDLRFAYRDGATVLDIRSFEVEPGEKVFLRGASGSGKSTLLGLVSGTLSPATGQIAVMGQDMGGMGPAQRDRFRADQLGIIFQLFNLIPYLSVLDNVLLPCRFSKRRRLEALGRGGLRQAAVTLLERLGLGSYIKQKVSTLSVGQQQRVAAARALIGSPGLIIADEPTSALDEDRQQQFLSLLLAECDRTKAALLFVSHNVSLGAQFDRVVEFSEINQAASREVMP